MRKQLLFLIFAFAALLCPARTVTGVVIQASDKEPVIGATVKVQGTQRGTATDIDGKFAIEAKDGEVLVVTYVGMNPQQVKVTSGSNNLSIEMTDDTQMLGEVVVTAYGQTQEKKKLNFAVQSLSSDQVTAGGNANFASSLQGKVAGLQVGTGGGSPNSTTQIVVRAISSMNNSVSNEPLIVVDGVAIRGAAQTLADLNPNDIENMSVLKGAAASALYGQEGANGVILITTKSGSRDGKVTVEASATAEISNCMRVPKVQNTFLTGSKGFYKENSGGGGWGPYLPEGTTIYDNVGDFLGTGFLQKYNVSVSGGTEKFNIYSSVAYTNNKGMVVKDYKNQLTVFLKGMYKPSEQVTVNLNMNYVDSRARGFGNSMSTIYGWAIDKNMKDYETLEGSVNWANRYDNWDALLDTQRIGATVSPYYGRYNDWSLTHSNRTIINGSIAYEPIKNLVFTGKVGYDTGYTTYDAYTVPRLRESDFVDINADDVQQALSDYQSRFGEYAFQPSRSEQLTVQGLVNYSITFKQDFSLNAFFGIEYRNVKSYSGSFGGYNFQLGGEYYSFNNVDPESYINHGQTLYHTRYNKYGYFGELRFDYKGLAQLSVTGRQDGSSRFKQVTSHYFYPSVTAGIIFSELFHLQNKWFSYGKIRGNWAKVGKDSPAYLFTDTYKRWSTFPDGGYSVDPTTSRAISLEPEMTKSWEIGADLRFFNSRTRLDIAYYSTAVDNQIVSVRVSPFSGTILQTRNEGKLENHGMEISLQQDIFKTVDFDWTAFLNFSYNRSYVADLPESLTEIQGTQYGDIFPVARLHESSTAISGKDYMRDPDGNVICNADGYPIIDPVKGNIIGNREPDFLLGIGSNLRYKNATLSFLFDGRCGGDVANITGRSLNSSGMHHLYSKYRNREIVFKGVVQNPDGTYSPNTTPIILDQNFISTYFNSVSSNFIEDGSYIRLSYVTIGYDFSSLLKPGCPIKKLGASITGRNLFLLTKYSGNDPAVMAAASNGTGSMGIDNYNVPTARSFNFTLKATF